MSSHSSNPTSRTGGDYTKIAAAIVTAAIAISASIVYTASSSATITRTETSTLTVTTTQSSISTMTLTVTSTYSANPLLAACSLATNPTPFPKLLAGSNTPALLCVRVYYYNVNATRTLNISQAIGISARSPRIFDGASNFTVVTSQNQLVLGGPNNENEGAVIAYAISANPGASGTYEILFSATYVINPLGPQQCGYNGVLSAGTGTPNYLTTEFSGCIGYGSNVTTNSSKYTVIQIPVAFSGFVTNNPVTLINGATYFVISGCSNSTQVGPNA